MPNFMEPQVAGISVDFLRIRRNQLQSARNVIFVGGVINNVGLNTDDGVGGHMHLHTEMPGIR